jgi:H+/Cl- antiporter ClcA
LPTIVPTNMDTNSHQSAKIDRELSFEQTILWSTIVGIVGGLVATAYYLLLETSQDWTWQTLPRWLEGTIGQPIPPAYYLLAATTIGGLLVGITLKVMGAPGEMARVINDVHDPGKIDIRQTPSMILASLFSITAGGSAGPEAPLVQINASFGSWLGEKLGFEIDSVRKLTFCGMSAALGAFFGAPLGGALFALEIPHRRGLEYYEALIPAVVSATASFVVFRFSTGESIGGIYHFAAMPELQLVDVAHGALLGAIGAGVAMLFVLMFRSIGILLHPFGQYQVALATVGGVSIGAIALFFPQTLFFGEHQIEETIATGARLGVTMLLSIALAKLLAICMTLHCGFRGGFIFPLFFVGAHVGLAISIAFPQIHPTLAMLCMMAATNVAITKTPISSTVILTVLSSTTMVPVILAASFVSFLLTASVSLLQTQRSRVPAEPTIPPPILTLTEPKLTPIDSLS